MLDELPELFVADFAVGIFVQVVDRLVDDLLQLRVRQVLASHHLKDLEEFPVGDEAVPVHVVDAEDELQPLLMVVIPNSKLCKAHDKF